jgi:hypothetical protein
MDDLIIDNDQEFDAAKLHRYQRGEIVGLALWAVKISVAICY